MRFSGLGTSQLEDAEKLEQLRALENGIRIRVWETAHASLRVDTPEDVPDVADRLQQYDAIKRELSRNRVVPSR